jgi:hypothetical protein
MNEDEEEYGGYSNIDNLMTRSILINNERKLLLGKDLGVYITKKNGDIVGRVDSVLNGEEGSFAIYRRDGKLHNIPWVKVSGNTNHELQVDGRIKLHDIILSEDTSLLETLDNLKQQQEQTKEYLKELSNLFKSFREEMTNIYRKLNDIQNTSKDHQSQPTIPLNTTDNTPDSKNWSFNSKKSEDGRPILTLCYDNKKAAEFGLIRNREPNKKSPDVNTTINGNNNNKSSNNKSFISKKSNPNTHSAPIENNLNTKNKSKSKPNSPSSDSLTIETSEVKK